MGVLTELFISDEIVLYVYSFEHLLEDFHDKLSERAAAITSHHLRQIQDLQALKRNFKRYERRMAGSTFKDLIMAENKVQPVDETSISLHVGKAPPEKGEHATGIQTKSLENESNLASTNC